MARIDFDDVTKYESTGNGEWFQLKNDGDIARVQFMADTVNDLEIYACHTVKLDDKDRYVDCLRLAHEPIDKCPLCAAGYSVKPVRFVVMYQMDDKKVKIWERGKTFIAKLQGLFNRYVPLSKYVFEIERSGKPGDKTTKYDIFPMDRVEPEDLSTLDAPNILGGIILDKSAVEMDTFLATGKFPDNDAQQRDTPVDRARNNSLGDRRVPAQGDQPQETSRSSRSSAPQQEPNSESLRGTRRGSRRGNDQEVF